MAGDSARITDSAPIADPAPAAAMRLAPSGVSGGATTDRRLTTPRLNLRPAEYPELLAYRDAIRHSYWLHTEYNLTDDVHDFRARVSDAERSAIKNAMLAIAQVEVAVKTFWGDLYKRYPKPEVGAVGYTFAESEVRHQDAYAHLLEVLGLNQEFERIREIPAIYQRVLFLNEHLGPRPPDRTATDREDALTLLLFSAFVEHVSLFGQFLIMKSFNRQRNLFKGIANIVEATSKEEQIHGLFGYQVVRTLREENPDWFDAAFTERVRAACLAAREAERGILDWIFEAGELDFLPRAVVDAYVEQRFDDSLAAIDMAPLFEPDAALVAQTRWFDEEVVAGKHYDFFHKRPTTYTKKAKSITSDDLF
ncbi:MAG: ribonucleotide-diphosphate reductase subunit beta [Trueperaceae bacterium]|nr:ribonucleotide-diphosphate reductase subunit beta [Trueperaceae bacterium]